MANPVTEERSMTKYDDFDFHVGEVLQQGQPEENAFTHIGFMLVWLIEHDLGSPKYFPTSIVQQVKDGTLRPNDLRDLVDGQLLGSTLKRAGAAFLDAYYESGYMPEFQAEFHDLPQYGVPDDSIHRARIDRHIDAAWQEWNKSGRPKPAEQPAQGTEADQGKVLQGLLGSLLGGAAANPQRTTMPPEPITSSQIDMLPKPHVDLDLEGRVNHALGGTASTQSCDARTWGSSVLSRLLRTLQVSGSAAVVATGVGVRPEDPRVEVYRVPSIDRARLLEVLQGYFNTRARKWQERPLGSIPARWATWRHVGLPAQTLVWFALDGYAVHVVGSERPAVESVAAAVAKELPGLGNA
jgi:hypothetical protein